MTYKNNDKETQNNDLVQDIDIKSNDPSYKNKNVKMPIEKAIKLEEVAKELNYDQTKIINIVLSNFLKGNNQEEKLKGNHKSEETELFYELLKENNNEIKKIKSTVDDTNEKTLIFYQILNSYYKSVDLKIIKEAFEYYHTNDKKVGGKSARLSIIEEDEQFYKNQTIARKQDINE